MEVVDFYPKSFSDIPEQDNPAFGNDECMMIIRNDKGHALVLHIDPDPVESVTSIATFWRHDLAVRFANGFEPTNG